MDKQAGLALSEVINHHIWETQKKTKAHLYCQVQVALDQIVPIRKFTEVGAVEAMVVVEMQEIQEVGVVVQLVAMEQVAEVVVLRLADVLVEMVDCQDLLFFIRSHYVRVFNPR